MKKHASRHAGHNLGARDVAGRPRATSGLSRRAWIGIAVGSAAAALIGERWWRYANPAVVAPRATLITVYASPTCGCCDAWVRHLVQANFHVTVVGVVDVTPIKRNAGVPDSLWSCHTAMVSGYIVEGHVPADVIQRALAERPAIAGLAVPGMPNGSPGMEGAGKDRYEVIAFARDGGSRTYAVR